MSAHFGLDLGSYTIKIIEAEGKGDSYHLKTLGEVKTPASLISTVDADKLAIVESVKNLAKDIRVSTKDVNVGLPETAVYTRLIELPVLSDVELASSINYEAEQYIPGSVEEVQIEYIVLNRPNDKTSDQKMEVLLVAGKKVMINHFVDIIEKAGFNAVGMETETLAVLRVLLKLGLSAEKPVLHASFGYRSTVLALFYGNHIRFVRTMSTGGGGLTRALVNGLGLDTMQAEQYKMAYGLDSSKVSGEVYKSLVSPFNAIVAEIKKAMSFFAQNHPNVNVSQIVASGAGAMMPGLQNYLAQACNCNVTILNPFAFFANAGQAGNVQNKPMFTVAAGLASREKFK